MIANGEMQRRLELPARRVDFGAGRQQLLNHPKMVVMAGEVQGKILNAPSSALCIGTHLEQLSCAACTHC